MKKAIILILATVLCLPAVAGCATPPPELEEVKAELVALMEKSYEINEILFGTGLKTEYDLSGLKSEYDPTYEGLYGDEGSYSAVVSEYKIDTDGDGVDDLTVGQFTTVDEIKAAASKVYSDDFVNKTLNLALSGDAANSIRARYREYTETYDSVVEYTVAGSDEVKYTVVQETTDPILLKYSFISEAGMNYIDSRGGRTVYDYDTMKIVEPSDGDTLVVEILAWYQDTTIDSSAGAPSDWIAGVPSGYSWHTARIIFVKQGNGWRLDTATY